MEHLRKVPARKKGVNRIDWELVEKGQYSTKTSEMERENKHK